jgi:hypothetical protein
MGGSMVSSKIFILRRDIHGQGFSRGWQSFCKSGDMPMHLPSGHNVKDLNVLLRLKWTSLQVVAAVACFTVSRTLSTSSLSLRNTARREDFF